MKRRRFVIGDIHGACKALIQCLQRSGFNYQNDTLISLGDIVDGHNEVYECVEELLKINNLVSIKGNHDEWFNEFIQSDFHPQAWTYGGKGTLVSYLKYTQERGIFFPSGSGYKTSLNSSDIPVKHRQFFQNQKPFHILDDNLCFVHAGFDRYIDFYFQHKEKYYWDRLLWSEALKHEDNDGLIDNFEIKSQFKNIFIGHTSTLNWGTDRPMTALNIINMDTGAGSNGRLTIMDIDTKEFWQSDPLSNLYKVDKISS